MTIAERLAEIFDRLGSIDARLEGVERLQDATHKLASATNGRVNQHDTDLAVMRAAADARAEERERAEAETDELRRGLEHARERRRDRVADVATGSTIAGLAWALAHFFG